MLSVLASLPVPVGLDVDASDHISFSLAWKLEIEAVG